MTLFLTLAGEKRRFELTRRKRQKRVYIRAEADGSFRVSAPEGLPPSALRSLILSRAETILDLPIHVDPRRRLSYAETIPLFGMSTRIERILPETAGVRHEASAGRLLVPRDAWPSQKTLEAYLKEQLLSAAREALSDLKARFPKLRGLDPAFRTRYMKQTFGSYAKNPERISLNLCLVHYPETFLWLIVAHEAAHRFHRDHSEAFHETLERFSPGHRQEQRNLQRHHERFLYPKHDKPLPL